MQQIFSQFLKKHYVLFVAFLYYFVRVADLWCHFFCKWCVLCKMILRIRLKMRTFLNSLNFLVSKIRDYFKKHSFSYFFVGREFKNLSWYRTDFMKCTQSNHFWSTFEPLMISLKSCWHEPKCFYSFDMLVLVYSCARFHTMNFEVKVVCVCVCVCARACVPACLRACVHACVRACYYVLLLVDKTYTAVLTSKKVSVLQGYFPAQILQFLCVFY